MPPAGAGVGDGVAPGVGLADFLLAEADFAPTVADFAPTGGGEGEGEVGDAGVGDEGVGDAGVGEPDVGGEGDAPGTGVVVEVVAPSESAALTVKFVTFTV